MTATRSADREAFLAEIIATAVEGGIGYWSRTTTYRWWFPDLHGGTAEPGPNGGGNAHARLEEYGDDETPIATHDLTLDAVATGLSRIQANPVEHMDEETRKAIRYADRHNTVAPDDGPDYTRDVDADLADQIVQVALLGEVIYA